MNSFTKYLTLSFLLMLGAHLLGAPSGVETDSTKSKYPINDPRNPECPCHKYQEQADLEYAKQLSASRSISDKVNQAASKNLTDHKGIKKVRSRRWFRPISSCHKVKATKRKCFRDRLSRCFHF